VNIASDDVSPYSESEKKDNEEKLKSLDADFNALKEKALEILGDKLENVKPSLNLTSSPACIRDPIGGMSVQMEYSFRAMGQNPPVQKRILELNANHPVVKKLLEMSGANDEKVSDVLKTLYDQSMILEGVPPDDPADFVKRIDDLMTLALVK
jgi:molecular chaperone HtpG